MCPTGLFGGASPHMNSNNFPTQCSRHPLRLSARKKSKREGRGGEEKARRRRREEDTEVETTTCHDIGRPPENSLLLQCFRVWGGMRSVCAARLSQKLPGYALGGMRPVREARGLPEHEIKEFGYALDMLR